MVFFLPFVLNQEFRAVDPLNQILCQTLIGNQFMNLSLKLFDKFLGLFKRSIVLD